MRAWRRCNLLHQAFSSHRFLFAFLAEMSARVEHEAGVEPACFGFKAQRGYRQPTARVWIRRQESDLRGLRSVRSWNASNPHLNAVPVRCDVDQVAETLRIRHAIMRLPHP